MSTPDVAVVGAGAIGAALATHLAGAGRTIALLATDFDGGVIDAHKAGEPHPAIAVVLHDRVAVHEANAWDAPLRGAPAVVLAVNGDGVVPATSAALRHARPDALWMVATKAWDLETSRSAAGVVADVVGDRGRVVAVAGPSLAGELARGEATNVVAAGWSGMAARAAADLLTTPSLRVDVSTDVDGVAICAVLKNVAAIALGICDGLAGEFARLLNTKAALFSIAVREMEEVVVALGGDRTTVLGPAGAGDLFVTCMGGRNARFGELIGSGMAPDGALDHIASTVEGYGNATTVVALGDRLGLRLPLMRAVAAVLFHAADARHAIESLVAGR